jgi:hypothetical protein
MGWLAPREPIFVEPTPLLVARLQARKRTRRWAMTGVFAAAVVLAVAAWKWLPETDSPTVYMTKICAVYVATLGVMWWILRGPRRAERRIARTVRIRVARPAAIGLREVAGTWHLVAAGASFVAAVLIGVVALASADSTQHRLAAVIYLAAVTACALVSVAAVVAVVRRPVLAEDNRSLAADDLLRVEDARQALGRYPLIVLVGQLAAVEAPGNWWIIGGYAVAVVILGRYAEVVEPTRPVAIRTARVAVAGLSASTPVRRCHRTSSCARSSPSRSATVPWLSAPGCPPSAGSPPTSVWP